MIVDTGTVAGLDTARPSFKGAGVFSAAVTFAARSLDRGEQRTVSVEPVKLNISEVVRLDPSDCGRSGCPESVTFA